MIDASNILECGINLFPNLVVQKSSLRVSIQLSFCPFLTAKIPTLSSLSTVMWWINSELVSRNHCIDGHLVTHCEPRMLVLRL